MSHFLVIKLLQVVKAIAIEIVRYHCGFVCGHFSFALSLSSTRLPVVFL